MPLNMSYMVRETGSNLRRNPTLTLATVINVGVSLFLVGASLIIGLGAKNTTRQFQHGVELVVFLEPQISDAQRQAVGSYIDKNVLVERKSFLDKAGAYKEFKSLYKDEPETVQSVRAIDLPTSFRVVPKDATLSVVQQLQTLFEREPGVIKVTAATDSVRRFQALSDLMKTVSGVTAAVLLAAALLLIINTIRMAALARRREIEVMKLVGATNWFVRIPFMLEGLTQGLTGAIFAAAGVFGLNELFKRRLGSGDLRFLQNFVVDRSHVVGTSLLLLVVGVLVGVVGSGVAVGRFVDV